MLMMSKNIAAAVLIFLVVVLAFLSQLGEAVVKFRIFGSSKTIKKLENLEGTSDSFYGFFLKPLVNDCVAKGFDKEILADPNSIVTAETDQFCGNVMDMNELLTQLDEVMKTKWITKKKKNEKLLTIRKKIHELVLGDLRKLKSDYDKLLTRTDMDTIEKEINKIQMNSEKEKFKESVEALEKELKNISPAAEGQKQNITAADKSAYKMLLIGEKMDMETYPLSYNAAYRQFCANALVYALRRLDARKPNGIGQTQIDGIQQIAHDCIMPRM